MVENRNWTELVPDLLRTISEKLDSVEDLIRFGCVCGSWRSVTLENKHKYAQFSHPPNWLMLCESEDDDRRSFFSISQNKIFHLELPEARGLRCWGSPFGWLITFSMDRTMNLLNPLSHSQVPLPSAKTLYDNDFDSFEGRSQLIRSTYIKKAVILTTPSLTDVENFMVVVVYSTRERLAFARPGDASWTSLSKSMFLTDLLHFDGQLYTVDYAGRVWTVDITAPNPNFRLFSQPPSDFYGVFSSFYLFELYGQLHIAARSMNCDAVGDGAEISPLEFYHPCSTDFFVVYKVDTTTSNWEEVETLGDYAFFVGNNTSFAVLASDCPRCKPDCIYFTDDYAHFSERLSGHDTGIHNYQTEETQLFDISDDMFSRYCPPIWFRPKLL